MSSVTQLYDVKPLIFHQSLQLMFFKKHMHATYFNTTYLSLVS